jgi:DHA1 family inner membrane transport protein
MLSAREEKVDMSIPRATHVRSRTNLVLATLFLGIFVLGSAELLVVGVLDLIATDLQVSIPAAGTLVTAYALGLAIGGPLLTALTIRLNKRTVLIGSISLFALAILAPVLVTDFGLFVATRAAAGAFQGVFIAVAFVTAMSTVPAERAGRAISMILSGVAVSAALGVPLGTLVGQGLGWRGSFVAIIALAGVALAATVVLVPSVPNTGSGVASQAKHVLAPRVLAVLGLASVLFASLYSALTYIVPFLRDVTGITGGAVNLFLFAYGATTAVGSFVGGRFADRNAARVPIVATAGVAVALLALYVVGSIPVLVALVLLVWGLFAFGMTPSLQLRVVSLAGPGGQLASSLPASAANIGIAAGPIAGGMALSDFGGSGPVLTGLVIAVVGIVLAWATSYLKPPVVKEEAAAATVTESAAKAA